MAKPRAGTSKDGKKMHYSVGAIIRKDDKFLMIDRMKPPYGLAGLAGHIDVGETAKGALYREVEEESGLVVVNNRLIYEEEINWNECSRGIEVHQWYLYECEVEGEIVRNARETKSIGWKERDKLSEENLESVWRYLFEKQGIV